MVGFSPGTPASSTTKTGCHDVAESDIKHQNQSIKSFNIVLVKNIVVMSNPNISHLYIVFQYDIFGERILNLYLKVL